MRNKNLAKVVTSLMAVILIVVLTLSTVHMPTIVLADGNKVVSAEDKSVKTLKYVYIEELELHTPATQNIVFSFADENIKIKSADLELLSNADGKTVTLKSTKTSGSTVLFSKDFEEGSIENYYELTSLSYETFGGNRGEINLLEDKENIYSFTVTNQKSDITPTSGEVKKEDSNSDGVTATAYAMSADGQLVSNTSDNVNEAISDSLDEANIQTTKASENNEVSKSTRLSANENSTLGNHEDNLELNEDENYDYTQSSAVDNPKSKGKLVVAFRAGHSDTYVGASYTIKSGAKKGTVIREEVLTLKVANAAVAELKKYSGVTVLNMRPNAKSPIPNKSTKYTGKANGINFDTRYGESADRLKLMIDAYNQGADVYVDLHFNASGVGANGAEIYVPNKNYNSAVYKDGNNVANDILDELVKLGLSDRGVKERNSSSTEYPNKSTADYYDTNYTCKRLGIPGLIVEHAFVDGSKDSVNLTNESFIKSLGVADAKGIAKTYGLRKVTKVGTYTPGRYIDVTRSASIRKSYSSTGIVLKTVTKGTRILSGGYAQTPEDGNWYKVLVNGQTGYLSTKDVTLSYADFSGKFAGTTRDVVVRSAVGTNQKILGTIKKGSPVYVYGQYRTDGWDWYKIKLNGKVGYVSRQYIQLNTQNPKWANYAPDRYAINYGSKILYSAANTTSTELGTIPNGATIRVNGYKGFSFGKMFGVTYNGKTGYISSIDVKWIFKSYNPDKYGKTTKSLVIRKTVGDNNPKVTTVPKGKRVRIYGYYDVAGANWYKINYNGKIGYVSRLYVKI
ncbi:MAG: SH3 domain-containing protein [Lachnospiraceae bacterium]|jgi:N-acetylmuramoyl-L-alanine amidase/uncharacterized protein YraI|nr:SH3 domain-containing protein [Lachnospiraceae bacterium]